MRLPADTSELNRKLKDLIESPHLPSDVPRLAREIRRCVREATSGHAGNSEVECRRPGKAVAPDSHLSLQSLAEAGDLPALMDAIIERPPGAKDFPDVAALVRQCVRQASKKSARSSARARHRAATAFVEYVLTRLEVYMVYCLEAANAGAEVQEPGQPISNELVGTVLLLIDRLMRLNMELDERWATTSRKWRLTRPGHAPGAQSESSVRETEEWYRQQVNAGKLPDIRTC
jgi:hypothetical protein